MVKRIDHVPTAHVDLNQGSDSEWVRVCVCLGGGGEGERGAQSNPPPLTQNFIFLDKFGIPYFSINIHTPFSLSYISF